MIPNIYILATYDKSYEINIAEGSSNGKSFSMYRGSSLGTIFGIWKRSYYAKFVLVGTT